MKPKRHLNQYGLIFLLLMIPAGLLWAVEGEMRLADVSRGSLLVAEANSGLYKAIPLQETQVDMTVTGPLVRTHLKQTFSNASDQWMEAVYAFPLPENAAVDHMDMQVGERVIEGQIKEKQEAKKVYQRARAEGKRTALVEQHRPNLFTTSVANIPPHGKITIKLQYQQLLQWRGQQFSLRFPMAITPRYTPAANLPATERLEMTQNLSAGWSILPGEIPNVVPLQATTNSPQSKTQINILLDAGFALQSLNSRYHEIVEQKQSETSYRLSLREGKISPDRDFVLEWQPRAGSEPSAAFFTQNKDSEKYGLLMLMPPDMGAKANNQSREVQFIIDTSGSMGGESIRQARDSLVMAIKRLQPTDHFNVIEFNTSTSKLFGRSRSANTSNVSQAIQYVTNLEAGGGTEMMPALQAALNQSSGNEISMLQQVIFITDGAVGNEQDLLNYIHTHLQDRRLFTVGIGSAPNSYFMKEAAHFGRGSYTFIGAPDEVSEKMQDLLTRIEKPVLTNVQLNTNAEVELLPEKMPDLYAGEPVVIAMKIKSDLESAVLTARRGHREWKQSLTLGDGQQQAGLDINWGREKIHQLMRSIIDGKDREQVRQQVIETALLHHLVSQYTSLVAVDITPVRPLEETLNSEAIDGVMPAGLKAAQQPVMLASGATDANFYLLLSGLLLMASLVINSNLPARVRGLIR